MIPLIALEEHFLASFIGRNPFYAEQFKWLPGIADKLTDIGHLRLQEMDKGSVSLQVVSHGPGLGSAPAEECRTANDELHAAVKKEGGKRFAGFAVLPMGRPDQAATELQRAVRELEFVGALVDNHVQGKMYDGEEYRAFFEVVQELDVPIYLHPTWPDDEFAVRFKGNFTDGAAKSLGSSGFGWHVDVGMHILKLYASGLFDQFPKLKIIIGHMGETLPFMHERILRLSKRWGLLKRSWKEVYDENIWITTSGVWSVNPMATILRNTRIDKILYSVDYPFSKNEDGLHFMEELEKSGLVTKEEFEMIGYKNAEALIKVAVQHQ
jgi:predicted TIM-barrel fold metal-dependent hydrolase